MKFNHNTHKELLVEIPYDIIKDDLKKILDYVNKMIEQQKFRGMYFEICVVENI